MENDLSEKGTLRKVEIGFAVFAIASYFVVTGSLSISYFSCIIKLRLVASGASLWILHHAWALHVVMTAAIVCFLYAMVRVIRRAPEVLSRQETTTNSMVVPALLFLTLLLMWLVFVVVFSPVVAVAKILGGW